MPRPQVMPHDYKRALLQAAKDDAEGGVEAVAA